MDVKNKNLDCRRMNQEQEQEQERSLPLDVQRLIHEFARPCTRPDWRLCRLSVSGLIDHINKFTMFSFPFYIPMEFTLPELSLYDRLCFMGRLKEQ
jgi:hypothetical protein